MATATLPITARRTYAERAHDYCRRVVSGEILASKWIKLACQSHLDRLTDVDSRWYFDSGKANKVCAWMERHPLEDGTPLRLQDWQVWFIASIFAWIDDRGIRQHREVLLLCPRGQGKSPIAALVLLWMCFFDGKPTARGLTAATTEKQAMEVFGPAQNFIRDVPAYKALGVEVAAKSIYSTKSRAKLYPVIGRAKFGGKPYVCCIDEAHQLTDTQQYDNFRTGLAKTPNSLLLTVTTAGVSSTENPAYQLQLDCQKILEGVIDNDRIFAAIFCADPEVPWDSFEALQMANPNLGVSVHVESLQLDQKEAVRNPSRQNGFRSMHLNQWMAAASSWLNMVTWQKCLDPDLTEERVKNLPCWLGSDLASKLDLSATVRVHREDIDGKPRYFVFCRTYIPESQVNDPANTHYQKWAKQGHLTATPGSAIDYSVIESDSLADIAKYQVQELAYDARYADQYSQRVSEASGIERVEVPPSPAELSPAMKELESAVAEGRVHHNGDPVLTWCLSNLLTRETGAGNYQMPTKARPENKIDAAIALLIAICRARLIPVQTTTTWAFQPFTI